MKLATLCYLRANGQTLMMHRIKKQGDMHAGKWNGLGGKLLPGETPEQCAIREVKEESGLTLVNPQWRGLLTFPAFNQNEDWYAFVFVGHNFSGELIDSDEGVLAWIDDDKLLDLNLWAGDRIFLPWLDQEYFFSGQFVYQDGELVAHNAVFYTPQQVVATTATTPTVAPFQPRYQPEDDRYCWRCGGPVSKRHCKIICHRCGFTRDCSDP
jgi:8-oxo-dGTP diphosphatase